MGKSRRRELVLHLADQVRDILSIAAAASTFEGDIARGFGDAEIDRIDERNGQQGDDVE